MFKKFFSKQGNVQKKPNQYQKDLITTFKNSKIGLLLDRHAGLAAAAIPLILVACVIIWLVGRDKPYTYDELLPKMQEAQDITAAILDQKKVYDGLREQLGAAAHDGLLAIENENTPDEIVQYTQAKYEPARQLMQEQLAELEEEARIIREHGGIVTLEDLEATRVGADQGYALRPVDPNAKSYPLVEAEQTMPHLSNVAGKDSDRLPKAERTAKPQNHMHSHADGHEH